MEFNGIGTLLIIFKQNFSALKRISNAPINILNCFVEFEVVLRRKGEPSVDCTLLFAKGAD